MSQTMNYKFDKLYHSDKPDLYSLLNMFSQLWVKQLATYIAVSYWDQKSYL